jgi:hypothetical protein
MMGMVSGEYEYAIGLHFQKHVLFEQQGRTANTQQTAP